MGERGIYVKKHFEFAIEDYLVSSGGCERGDAECYLVIIGEFE